MDALHGPESLQVVYNRFSDGVDVLKCVAGFIKEVSEVEQAYSNSLQKLIKSPLYKLHTNFFTQFFGSNPFEEIGTVKCAWVDLGNQLSTLVLLHADKAKAYLNDVRQPLLDLTPKLEETRREVRNRSRELKEELEAAANKHQKMKQKYQQAAQTLERHQQKLLAAKSESLLVAGQKTYLKNENKAVFLEAELAYQETVYQDAYDKHREMGEKFNKEVKEMFLDVQARETERVNTIKKSLQEFARTLSNTAPGYLEAMQHILISMDQINSSEDILSFVEAHATFKQQLLIPPFERHPLSVDRSGKGQAGKELSSGNNYVSLPDSDLQSSEISAPSSTPGGQGGAEPVPSPADRSAKSGAMARPKIWPRTGGRNKVGKDSKSQVKSPQPKKPERPALAEKPKPQQSPNLVPRLDSKEVGGQVSQRVHQNPRPRQQQRPKSLIDTKPSLLTKPVSLETEVQQSSPAGRGSQESQVRQNRGSEENQVRQNRRGSQESQVQQNRGGSQVSLDSQVRQNRQVSLESQVRGGSQVSPESQVRQNRGGRVSLENEVWSGNQLSFESQVRQDGPAGNQEERQLLEALLKSAKENDYYGLLRVQPNASGADLARARRERAKELHPDHFPNDQQQREIAQEELVRVNQAYQDVLANTDAKTSYDQLCVFRKNYPLILEQKVNSLLNAQDRLKDLRKKLKRFRCPQSLLEELDNGIQLVQIRIDKLLN